MANEQTRYGRNRNRWRKVYAYGANIKPKTVTFLDNASSNYLTLDLNKVYKHYDYHIRQPDVDAPTNVTEDIYEEGIIHFNNETEKAFSFTTNWQHGPPYVVYSIETGFDDNENVNVYGYDYPSLTGSIAGVSAPFSGTVRYRAISAPSYPVLTSYGTTSSFYIFAGAIHVSYQNQYTASYSMPGDGTNLIYRATAHEYTNAFDNDVSLETDSISAINSLNTISAPMNNRIHFHVVFEN